MPSEEQIILVDQNDAQVGAMGKLATHEKGLLHRGFSIIVKNDKGEIMLQKRARGKYHSGGLWTNTCCGHPKNGEDLVSAVHRRLKEEMGFDCELKEILTFTQHLDRRTFNHVANSNSVPRTQSIQGAGFIYKVNLDKGLKENEFLHVFLGKYNNAPALNPEEADDWQWITMENLKADIAKNPDKYTYWFKIALKKAEENNIVF